MSPSTCILVLSSLFVAAYARIHPVMHPFVNHTRTGLVSPDVIAKACEPSLEKAFCVSVLKFQTISDVNDLKQATFVALQAASGEAVATSELIKVTRQKEEEKDVVEDTIEEETLADCSQSYASIVDMLADATNALLTGPESDVRVEIQAAMTTAETCAKSINAGKKTRQVDEVAKKNENVRRFCSNALGIYNVYAKGH
ncbi:hypothetical protein L2E82_00025 [Cichorium intybus]|uniref:Uncharacterized protein n=1 Tax=Cichorium intybus TaxID=13427 RepID=A0ACB9GX78_CICIN|nr:hypothetical protein L2E82_00025 [Cichorium intybus]